MKGSCHCGAVRFSFEIGPPPFDVLDCSCSICSATGFLHLIVPHEAFTLEQGEAVLSSYRFGSGAANHLFCRHCGVKSFYQPRSHPDAWSVNARCLDETVDLRVIPFDGKNWEEAKAALDGAAEAG